MGVAHSDLHNDLSSSSCFGDRNLSKLGLGDFPEACVAMIVENLDPVEICRFSKLNRAFRGASWADCVWESKLPPNYRDVLEKILGGLPENLQKRDLYTFLCRINSFDDGTKVRSSHTLSLSLSSPSGFICKSWDFFSEIGNFFNKQVLIVQKVWIDKRTSGVCLSISAKGLSITGIDDRRYWSHIPTDESR